MTAETAVPASAPIVSIVVLQPTAFCNINCSYCYLPDRNNKHVLEQSTVTRLFTELFASGWTAPQLTVIWHAGEPLVVPPAFYREAFATIERLRPPTVEVRHAFQTNGMLIDADWCALFRDWKVGVGVSLDGPRELHDANRKTRSGAGTFDKTIAGIRMLQAAKLPFHVISVLSATSLDDPDALLAFYVSEGIDHVCFNVEESEGSHVSAAVRAARTLHRRYADFLRRFWQAARDGGRVKFLREIDLAIPRVFRPSEAPARNVQIDAAGDAQCRQPRQRLELLARAARPQERRPMATTCWATSTPSRWPASTRPASTVALHRDIQAGVAACSADLRVLLRVRRRRAGQQAVRERQLRQHAHLVLHADPDRADRSHPRGLRPPRAELGRRRHFCHRRAQVPSHTGGRGVASSPR